MKRWTRLPCSKCGLSCLVEENPFKVGAPLNQPVVCAFCPQGNRVARHVRFKDIKNLGPEQAADLLVIEHGSSCGRFRCACGKMLSWFTTAKGTDEEILGVERIERLLRGTCPNCGNVHWKRK